MASTKRDFWEGAKLERCVQGLISVCLSLKLRPCIRYDRLSEMASTLARQLETQINKQADLFTFSKTDVAPILIILDRRTDCVTPLLMQWTFQAMIHELVGICNGRVTLHDNFEIVLNARQDDFFAQHRLDHLGDLGRHVKELVDQFQRLRGSHVQIESVADMKRFVEEYPKFRETSNNVSKHVEMLTQVNRMIQADSLLLVSELEQSLAVPEQHHSAHFKQMMAMIANESIASKYKVRLSVLYMLKYRFHNHYDVGSIVEALLKHGGVAAEDLKIIDLVRRYAIHDPDKEQHGKTAESFIPFIQSVVNGLRGVDNVYTQHVPWLDNLVDLLLKGQLKETRFPFLNGTSVKTRPQQVVLFMVNGVTFEESKFVSERNAKIGAACQILLGGSVVHNSNSFLTDVKHQAFVDNQNDNAV